MKLTHTYFFIALSLIGTLLSWTRLGYVAAKTSLLMGATYAVQPEAVRGLVHSGIQAGFLTGAFSCLSCLLLVAAIRANRKGKKG